MADDKWYLEELLEELKAVEIPESSAYFSELLDPSLRVLGVANDRVKRVVALMEDQSISIFKYLTLSSYLNLELEKQFPELRENSGLCLCEGWLVAVETIPEQKSSDEDGLDDDIPDLDESLMDPEDRLDDDDSPAGRDYMTDHLVDPYDPPNDC